MNLKTDVTAQREQSRLRLSRRRVLQTSLGSMAVAALHRGTGAAQDASSDPSLLQVFPSHGWRAASHLTQVSFRGEIPESFGSIYAIGKDSGDHAGTVTLHSDGQGFSWFPDYAFRPGEEVTVHTKLNIAGADNGAFTFRCAIPRIGHTRGARNEPAEEDNVHRFRSRPGLVPPKLTAEMHSDNPAPGLLFLSVIQGQGQNGALIVDNEAEPIWFLPASPKGHELFDLNVAQYQGEPVLTWWAGIRVLGQGSGHWVIANNAYEEIATLNVGNGYPGGDMHDMLLTAENTAIVGAYNTIEWDLSAIGGQEGFVADCVLQEIDIATGCVIFEWHNVDHIDLDESYLEVDPEKPDVTLDYFHYNSVAIDADGSLIVCARNTWATYKVDRNSGDVIWRLGGKRSDFELADGAEYAWQHDARPLGGNLLSFFDNGPNNGESRGLILELDTDRMTASVDREFRHSEKISAGSQGSLQILPNGNVLVGWGSEPLLTEFTADGEPILDVRFPGEKQSYRARRFEWVGRPSDVPHLRAETGSGGNVTVYASWNGATEVAAWRVLAGEAENDLTAVGEPSPRTGFETRIAVTSDARFFAVEAIDAQGESLGISRPEEARESSS